MPHYNFALSPMKDTVSKCFTDIAQLHLKGIEDGYLLGKRTLPHITLTHFTANNDDEARQAYKDFKAKRQIMLEVTGSKIETNKNNTIWAAYFIKKDDALMALQKEVYEFLKARGLAPEEPPKTYRPHVTLGRLTREPYTLPSVEELPTPHKYKFRMSLGESTDIGVYIKHLAQ